MEISRSKEYLREKMSAASRAEKQQNMAAAIEPATVLPAFKTETAVEEAPLEEAEEMPVVPFKAAAKREETHISASEKARREPIQAQTARIAVRQREPGKQQLKTSTISVQAQQKPLSKQLPGEETELFSAIGGYSELEEIKSIIEVGLQHGGSLGQIKESLIATGYSKNNVEKVLSSIKE